MQHDRVEDAISREKAMKAWKRRWKTELIEQMNPEWNDLCDLLNG
jgi:putative endonuclease